MTDTGQGKFRIILVGSSLGGLPVIEKLLMSVNKDKFSLIIAQHMPEGYTGMWVDRLDSLTPFSVKEGINGEILKSGHAYIGPGNRHILLDADEPMTIVVNSDPPVKRFRPSIDVLFNSVINHSPERFVAVILSGMCDDGVDSIVDLRRKGFITIAQDRPSSAVFGMNKEAIERGGIELVLSPDEMVEYLNRM
jgi:two-component system chemotaxis response regulator CheB